MPVSELPLIDQPSVSEAAQPPQEIIANAAWHGAQLPFAT
jgi:hypothetical protein